MEAEEIVKYLQLHCLIFVPLYTNMRRRSEEKSVFVCISDRCIEDVQLCVCVCDYKLKGKELRWCLILVSVADFKKNVALHLSAHTRQFTNTHTVHTVNKSVHTHIHTHAHTLTELSCSASLAHTGTSTVTEPAK